MVIINKLLQMANASDPSDAPKIGSRTIDLYNYDQPENSRSRYILTSPRSLEACSRLRIKPVDLLPKSYEQFVAESSHLGLHKNALQLVYKEYEEQRLQRLHNARLERERIIEEEQQLEQQTGHKATQQSDKLRSHSVTLPTSVNNNNITVRSVMMNDATKGNKTTRKAVNSPRERFTKSDTLPVSDISRPSTSTRLPPAVMSLPEKDQRILQAMAQKMSSEQEQEEIRKMAAKLWHEEALLEKASKQVLERQRQEQLEQQKRINQKKLLENKKLQESIAQEEALLRHTLAEEHWRQWNEKARQQAMHKAQLIEERSQQQKRRKAEQEQRLKMLEAQRQVEQLLTKEYLQSQHVQVTMNKEAIERKQMLERHVRNNSYRTRHVELKAEVDKLESDKSEYLQQIVRQKMLLGEQRHHQQQAMKQSQLQKSVMDRKLRSGHCQQNRQLMNEQLKEWQRAVDQYTKASVVKAEGIVEQMASEKSHKASAMRKIWEEEQWKNKQRIDDEEADKRLMTTMEIERKNARTTDLMKAKDVNIQKSRQSAGASAQMRHLLKESFQRSTFDRMAREAELQASIGNRRRSTIHNKSHVVIG